MSATIVQATDNATVLSATQQASSSESSGSTPVITMSWTGQNNAAVGGPWDRYETTPDELPPECAHFLLYRHVDANRSLRGCSYTAARSPTDVVVYTFSPHGFNSMFILPPYDVADTRPLYHISISFNPFIPTAGVTTVHRGANDMGEFVADFEYVARAVQTDNVLSDFQMGTDEATAEYQHARQAV
jgi:hypothetical protein